MFSANSSQVSDDKLFVEDVFSTWLYTGNSSTQTITNGIDLAGKGGMVWVKDRTSAYQARIVDTVRGATNGLIPSATNSTVVDNSITALNSNGFTVGNVLNSNGSGDNYVSWTFRKAPKFFDVVTYTGNGVSTGRNISHALGVRPGFIIVKRTDSTSDWAVLATDPVTGFYHGGVTSTPFALNLTNAKTWSGGGSAASATTFNACHVQLDDTTNFSADFNVNGATYVAYLFASNAGGFGNAGTDSVVSCGSYTGNGAAEGPTVTLGWEPQWVMVKNASSSSVWMVVDNMRGMTANGDCQRLDANQSVAESSAPGFPLAPTATGFQVKGATALNGSGQTSIYIAIRRPMKTPTLGTSVYNAVSRTGSGATTTVNAGMTVDLSITSLKGGYSGLDHVAFDRLRGAGTYLATNTSSAQTTFPSDLLTSFATQNGVILGADADPDYNGQINNSGFSYINWYFRRAPGFFDVVCYTGNGVNGRTINHNLGVTPELLIMKNRSSAGYSWFTWDKSADLSQVYALLALNDASGRPAFNSGNLNSTVPTSTVFTIGGDSNASGQNYVNYLFASCPGVSKVGSYTGNGSSQTINCGFAAGARFVMIKRTNAAGDWYVWDTARGIVAGNDPHLSLNTTAGEVTTDDTIDTDSSGFVVNQVSATNVNVNAATYIYLAIA